MYRKSVMKRRTAGPLRSAVAPTRPAGLSRNDWMKSVVQKRSAMQQSAASARKSDVERLRRSAVNRTRCVLGQRPRGLSASVSLKRVNLNVPPSLVPQHVMPQPHVMMETPGVVVEMLHVRRLLLLGAVDNLLLSVLLVQSAIRAVVLQAEAVTEIAGGVLEETTEVTLHGEGHVQPRPTVKRTAGDVVQLQTVTLLVAEPDHSPGKAEVKATHGVDQSDLQVVAATRAAGGKEEPEEELLRLVMTMAQGGLLRLVMMMAQGGRRLQGKRRLL